MPVECRYDFSSLTWLDFELLCRDLVQAELSVTLEGFGPGSDGGIDFRYSSSEAEDLVIQCKHHESKNGDELVRHLRKKELPKVEKLKPKRYIICCSQKLTRTQRATLQKSFAPFLNCTADIWDRVRLNSLLEQHASVHDAHYKLWLPTTAVVKRLLHGDVYDRTRAMLEAAIAKRERVVETPAFRRAARLLERFGYCVITGEPGVGKSTLAEMLVLASISEGYEPVFMLRDVEEGNRLLNPDPRVKQVFYYDDFLGQSSELDRLGKNEDSNLALFVQDISAQRASKRLIFTTRKHVLNRSILDHERLERLRLQTAECILHMKELGLRDRAHLLFNHLVASDLDVSYLKALFAGETLVKIVRHENFNPRLIEYMTVLLEQSSVTPECYAERFLGNLDKPDELWRAAFYAMSARSKHLLLVLVTMPEPCSLVALEKAFMAFHSAQAQKHNSETRHEDFQSALKELHGAFVVDRKDYAGRHVVSITLPSVRDYVLSVLESDVGYRGDLMESATFLHQVVRLLTIGDSPYRKLGNPRAAEALVEKIQLVATATTYGGYSIADAIMTLHGGAHLRRPETDVVMPVLLEYFRQEADDDLIGSDDAFHLARFMADKPFGHLDEESFALEALKSLLFRASEDASITSNYDRIAHWRDLLELGESEPDLFTDADIARLRQLVQANVADAIEDQLDTVRSNKHAYDMLHDSANQLEKVAEWLGLDMQSEIQELHERGWEAEDEYLQLEEEQREAESESRMAPPAEESVSDNEIMNIFAPLLDGD